MFAALLRADPIDVVTPYGYGGPVAVGAAPPVAAFAEAYEAWCARRGVVSTFAVFHPLFANARAGAARLSSVQPIGDTIAGRWRRRRSARGHAPPPPAHGPPGPGAEVEVRDRRGARATSALPASAPSTRETMHRAGADPFYFFGETYWAALASEVPLVAVEVWHDGEHLAASLGLTGAPWLHYHLGAQLGGGPRLGANHLAHVLAGELGPGARLRAAASGRRGRRAPRFAVPYKERFAPGGERRRRSARRSTTPSATGS